LQIPLNFSCIK